MKEEQESKTPVEEALDRERLEILAQIEDWLELPIIILGFVWLVLIAVELVRGLGPFLETIFFVIWGIFVLDFALRFVLAPQKLAFLRGNWLTVISLMVPALRVFHFARMVHVLRLSQTVRSIRLIQVVGSINRGMGALRASMGRRGFGYAIILTGLVTLAGSAGMLALEGGADPQRGIHTFGDSLWWTAMIMTTLGTDYWPLTPEGRVLGFLLSLYALGVFGYVTASLASFFIGRDAESEEAEIAGTRKIESLRAEIRLLRAEIQHLTDNLANQDPDAT